MSGHASRLFSVAPMAAALMLCAMAAPALAGPPVPAAPAGPSAQPAGPDFKAMPLDDLKAYYDEGSFTSFRDAMKELIARGELEEIHKNLRDPHPNRNHYMTAWAVAWMQPDAFVDDMAALLDDIDPGVRYYAVYYLTGLHKVEYAKRIEKLLADPSPTVRGISVGYFGTLKLSGYRKAIAKLAADPDAGVRSHVQETLEDLK
jgi:hypothetical protein